MKKKVISVVIDTELTNEQIESGKVVVMIGGEEAGATFRDDGWDEHAARSVRVLDSDEIG